MGAYLNVLQLKSIKAKLSIGLCVILLMGFGAMNFLSYNAGRTVLRQSMRQDILPGISNDIYQEIQRDLITPIRVSSLMANDTFLKDWIINGEEDVSKITKFLREIRNEYGFFSTFLVSGSTRKYYSYNGVHKVISPEDDHDIWYYKFIGSGKKYELDVDADEVSKGALTIFINHRLEDYQGSLLGVTGVGLKMSKIGSLLGKYQERYGKHIYFVDKQGLVQVHPEQEFIESRNIHDQEGLGVVASDLLSETATGPVVREYDLPGTGHTLVIAQYVPEFEWFLVVEHSEGRAMQKIRAALFRNIVIGLLVTALVIVVNVLLVNHYQGKLESMATTDDLTGLPNRRCFMAEATREMANASRSKWPVSMLMVDLDHFKNVNDSCGHHVGDEVLRRIADILRQWLRRGDLAGRIGGEEFAVILPRTEAEAAFEVAERLRQFIEEAHLPDDEQVCKVTASIGVATDADGQNDLAALMKQADEVLYQAKSQGRNRVLAEPDRSSQA